MDQSSENDMDRTDPEFVRGAAANVPPKKRKMRTDAVFLASALPTKKHYKIK